MSNQVPLRPPHLQKLLSKYDDFLGIELARVRNLPENQPNTEGEYTELVYNLVAALSKTKGINFIQSLDTVHNFLSRHAPEIRISSTFDGGPAQMKRMRDKMAAYTVDEAHRDTSTKKWWQFWRK